MYTLIYLLACGLRRIETLIARKRSLRRSCCFYTCLSVILFTGGWYCRWYPSIPCSRSRGGVVSQHALQVSRPTPKGEVEGDLARGGLQSTPKGKVEGDLAGRSPGPHLGVCLLLGGACSRRGACSRGCGDTP